MPQHVKRLSSVVVCSCEQETTLQLRNYILTLGGQHIHVVSVFNNTNITSPKDISESSREILLAKTSTAEQQEFLSIKTPLTDFYDLPDINPHLDWPYEILHDALLGYIKY